MVQVRSGVRLVFTKNPHSILRIFLCLLHQGTNALERRRLCILQYLKNNTLTRSHNAPRISQPIERNPSFLGVDATHAIRDYVYPMSRREQIESRLRDADVRLNADEDSI